MKEKNEDEKKPSQKFIPTTVYLPPDLKEQFDQYCDVMHFGTRSQGYRRGIKLLMRIFPLDKGATGREPMSLSSQLESINEKLEALKIEKRLTKREKTELEEDILNNGINQISNANQIREDIIELLREYGPLKDFVLMDKLGETYERGAVWGILMELQKEGIVNNNKNEWFLRNG